MNLQTEKEIIKHLRVRSGIDDVQFEELAESHSILMDTYPLQFLFNLKLDLLDYIERKRVALEVTVPPKTH